MTIDTRIQGMNLNGMSNGDVWTVQSDAFIGHSPSGSVGAGVVFDSLAGTYTFDGNVHNGNIELSDFGGLTPIITAGEDVTFTMVAGSLTLHNLLIVIPEPGTILWLAPLLLFVRRRR